MTSARVVTRGRKLITVAQMARDLFAADATLTSSAIARQLSSQLRRPVSHQQVQDALRASGSRPGPKPRAAQTERVSLTLDAAILARMRAAAEREGTTLAQWIEGCHLVAEQLAPSADDPTDRGGRPVDLHAKAARLRAALAEVEREIAARGGVAEKAVG